VVDRVAVCGATFPEHRVDVRDERHGLARHHGLVVDEDGLFPRQEEERVELIGQLDEIERCPRLRVQGAWLPDLEPMECAQDDVSRRRRGWRSRGPHLRP
jgi:hypothetical protein